MSASKILAIVLNKKPTLALRDSETKNIYLLHPENEEDLFKIIKEIGFRGLEIYVYKRTGNNLGHNSHVAAESLGMLKGFYKAFGLRLHEIQSRSFNSCIFCEDEKLTVKIKKRIFKDGKPLTKIGDTGQNEFKTEPGLVTNWRKMSVLKARQLHPEFRATHLLNAEKNVDNARALLALSYAEDFYMLYGGKMIKSS